MKFNLNVPTEIIFGEDVIKNNYIKFEDEGNVALIVTGNKSSKFNGALKDVLDALDRLNKDYYIFDKVEENPSLETIEKGSSLGRGVNADFVIGIGGGSSLDAAKAIAMMIRNKNVTKENIFDFKDLEALPVIAIPTTSGTGSEVTQYSIVTDNKKHTKRNLGQTIYPKIAFLDPKYTEKLSVQITRNTAMDAFSHIVEGYLNSNSTEYTDKLAIEALKYFSEALDSLLKGDFSRKDRENMMIASTIAGGIIAHNGTSIPHGMGYALTYNKGIPHGLSNCCLYPEYLKTFKDHKKLNNIISILGFSSLKDLNKNIKRLSTVNVKISEDEIKEYTDNIWNNKEKLKNHPEEITYDELYKIYYNSLIGSNI